MTAQARVPVALDPPLRPFRPGDASACARLNDMASGGLVLPIWQDRAGPGGDAWETGRLRQIERMENGQAMVVADTGAGAEAVLMGNPLAPDPEDPAGSGIFAPLVELENLVRDSWYLNILATLPEARGKGHGTRLLAAAETIARAEGRARISLIVSDSNDLALPLYLKTGYAESARRPKLGTDGHWLLLLRQV